MGASLGSRLTDVRPASGGDVDALDQEASSASAFAAPMAFRGVVASFLFGVTSGDPVTYAMAAVAFAGVAVAAVAIPARRGSRVDPIRALQYE